jgi:signal peptidase
MSALTPGDCARSLAVEVLRASGELQLKVTGTSMLPTLWPGDLARIQSRPSSLIRPGDVVLFERERRLFIHRVVRVSPGQDGFVTTRGDCMTQDDAPIAAAEVLGRITAVQRGNRPVAMGAVSQSQRLLGWLLGRWDLLCRIALRWHAMRYKIPTAEAAAAQS